MSTSFDVLPTVKLIPKLADVLYITNKRLQEYTELYNFKQTFNVSVEMSLRENNKNLSFNTNSLAQWDSDKYVCFFLDTVSGGIQAEFDYVDELIQNIWNDEIEIKQASEEKRKKKANS